MSIIQVENLEVFYGKRKILKDITIEIEKGKFYGIIGPNGSGKSTFLSAISGLLKRNSGEVLIKGKKTENYKLGEISKIIAVMSQGAEFRFPYSIRDIVSMGRFPYSKGKLTEEEERVIEDAMEKTEISAMSERKINELSGGERQRVIFAKTLCQNGEIILIDEGFSNIDIYYQLKFIKLLKEKVKEEGKTILFVMHDLNMTKRYCEKILVFYDGMLYTNGDTSTELNENILKNVFKIQGFFKENSLEYI